MFSCILAGGKLLLLLLLVFIIFASKEYTDILRNKGFLPFFKVILTISITMILVSACGYDNMIPIVQELDEKIKEQVKQNKKVVLFGYSAGTFITMEYVFTKAPYINLQDYFYKRLNNSITIKRCNYKP